MNDLNSGSLDTLNPGECLLVSARKIDGGKISLEFAEISVFILFLQFPFCLLIVTCLIISISMP